MPRTVDFEPALVLDRTLRPVSPDGVPYLGQVPGLTNLLAATGHAMMGLSLGPVSGRLVADLLVGDAPFRPISAMSPARF